MTIPEKIILEIWDFIVQNYGMTSGIVCIFIALHLLWWERCRKFWQAVGYLLNKIARAILWPINTLTRKARDRWQEWKREREKRRIIAEFDRLYPEYKDKYTEYGKLKYMGYKQMLEMLGKIGKAPNRET